MSVIEREVPACPEKPRETGETDPLRVAALQFVNRVRAAHDLDPLDGLPKGERRMTNGCVIAAGIKAAARDGYVSVGSLSIGLGRSSPVREEDEQIAVPSDVRRFMACFDCGDYPDLDVHSPSVTHVFA